MKNVLVLDSDIYKKKQNELMRIMKKQLAGESYIFFTSYEDEKIRRVRNYKHFGSFLQHLLYWKKSLDYAKKINKEKNKRIYCLNPIVGIFLGLKNRNKHNKIIMGGFLFEPKRNKMYYLIRKYVTKKALKGIDKVIVYSSREVKYYQNLFPKTTFVFIKYGIDFEENQIYTNNKLPNKYIFTGGGSNRNYNLLIKAYNKCPKEVDPLVIATQGWRLKGLELSRCVLLEDVVVETFGNVLSRAKMLILALNDANISVGHMVMFQAMKLNVPVIVNDIPAIRDYVDDTSVYFYDGNSADELSDIIWNCDYNTDKLNAIAKNAKKIYEKELTFNSFIKRFIRC